MDKWWRFYVIIDYKVNRVARYLWQDFNNMNKHKVSKLRRKLLTSLVKVTEWPEKCGKARRYKGWPLGLPQGRWPCLQAISSHRWLTVSWGLHRITGSFIKGSISDGLLLVAQYTISVHEVETTLAPVYGNKATDPDRIRGWILKEIPHVLALPLSAICNNSPAEEKQPVIRK